MQKTLDKFSENENVKDTTTVISKKLVKKMKIDRFNSSFQRKSLIRFVSIIIDFSSAARKQEMRPNRAIVIKSYLAVSAILNWIHVGNYYLL